MNTSIRHQFFYSYPVETVWDYLTKSELLSQWLMNNDFLLTMGHEFHFRTKPHPDLEFDGIVYCKVLEIVPFKKLSYSWKIGSGDGKMALDSIVVWTLFGKDGGTELHLDHSGFTNKDAALYAGMMDGWSKNMQKITALLTMEKNGTVNN
jgi:uncharacterized protein YndB with AHSA1/START domain